MDSKEEEKSHPYNDLIFMKVGEGGYSRVYFVRHNGEELARKDTWFNEVDLNMINEAFDEISTLQMLYHRNIVELKDYYIDIDRKMVYIYSKYYKSGDLWRVVDKKNDKNEDFSIFVYIYIYLLLIGDLQLHERFDRWIEVYS